mgnify:CR=1 FL=1
MKNLIKIGLLVLPFISYAQKDSLKQSPLEFNAGIETNHLWRGIIISDKPVITATASLSLNKEKSLKLGIWGGTSISNEEDGTHYKEINYFLKYEKNNLSIGLWDLHNTRREAYIGANDIFEYSKDKSKHIIDLRTSYQLPEKFPLKIEADFLLYGSSDALYKDNGEHDKNKYSTYVELSYPVIKNSIVNLSSFVGSAFAWNTNKGNYSLYGNGESNFQVVNVGITASKDITVFNKKFPVYMTTMWNPTSKFARIQLATSLF